MQRLERGTKGPIVVASRNVQFRRQLVELLEAEGFDAVALSDTGSALAECTRRRPPVAICEDVNGRTADRLALALKQAQGCNTRVLAIVGRGAASEMLHVAAAENHPVDPARLLECIDRITAGA